MWFSDGTGNDPDTRTNVYWLYKLVEKVKTDSGRLDIFISHDSGIGTWLRQHKLTKKIPDIIGLGGGAGFAKNIRDGYRFLVANYDETSKVYLFGFSRGAYTSRSLSNFIYFCGGMIKKPLHPFYKWMVIHYLFNLYRWRNFIPKATLSNLLTKAKIDYAIINCPIEVIGVWDTVGSVGLPTSWNWFHLDGVTPDTKYAIHALALDERRKFYNPIKFVKDEIKPGNESGNNQIIKEVWFAGVHSDVGGGYKQDDKELPHVSLKWMLSQLKRMKSKRITVLAKCISPIIGIGCS
jgi:uncharacterized protein (DUF2235 family)